MNPPDQNPEKPVLRVEALEVLDAGGSRGRTCLLAERVDKLSLAWRVLACGRSEDVGHHPAAAYAEIRELPHSVLLPGLVNAHTHLDLTHIGPRPHDPAAGFVPWVDMVRLHRRSDPEAIAESVRMGIELSVAGGTVAVGDIAGTGRGYYAIEPYEALRASPLLGVSYIECFGIGLHRPKSAELLELFIEQHRERFGERGPVRLGLQPHAPNTVEIPHYRWILEQAERLGCPACTHLAETPEERQFIASGSGPQRELLERLSVWDDTVLEHIGKGHHPVRHLEPILSSTRLLVAHCNDATDEAIEILTRTGTCVAYCPRASAYFGAERHFGAHRYQDMLDAGVNVCLGTDSLVNLPPEAADPGRGMSILDEMRFLHHRDGTDALRLLRMATDNGARALQLDPERFRFREGGEVAGVLAVRVDPDRDGDPLDAALKGSSPAEFLR